MRALVARVAPGALAFGLLASGWGALHAQNLGNDVTPPRDTAAAGLSRAHAGWRLETAVGFAVWGENSPCSCGTFTAETTLTYLTPSGLFAGARLNAAATELAGAGALGELGVDFSSILRRPLPLGIAVVVGPKFLIEPDLPIDDYRGWQYGAEVQLRPWIGARRRVQAVFAFGSLTVRERYRPVDFRAVTRTEKHSGWRLRMGVAW